ncbi:MAG: tripartite tricarboxylate transporter substrate binding protein [Pseudomonadota bacterium]
MITRRTLFASVGAAALAVSPTVVAQDFPSRPIRLVVPFPPGGALDAYVRAVQEDLGKALGQPVIAENLAGAGGAIGAQAVARARPDGYTLMAGTIQTLSMNAAVRSNLGYDPIKDFVPVVQTVMVNYILVVHPGLPVKTLPDLIAYAKANPGKVSYATSGTGSPQHMAVALLQAKTEIDLLHVPYKGIGAVLNDLLAGQVLMTIADQASLLPHVKAGKLRAIAGASRRRIADLPELPTIAETAGLSDYEAVAWQGLAAPASTPLAVVQRLNEAVNRVQTAPAMSERLRKMGFELVGGSADAFRQYIAADLAKWKKVARDNSITVTD